MTYSEAQHKHVRDVFKGNDVQLLAVWEYSADAMSLSDAEGVVLAANPAYYQLYGYSPEEVIGKSFAIIFPAEIRDSVVEQYKGIFQKDEAPPTFESNVRRADGTTRTVESRAAFIQQDGQRVAMLSIIRDVSERVR